MKRKEYTMYAALRRGMLSADTVDVFVKQATDTFAPTLTALPGFVDYFIVRVGTEGVVSISLFETQETAEASNAAFAYWARKHQIFSQFQEPPELIAGEVVFHPTKEERGS
jgi:hypothetical protein